MTNLTLFPRLLLAGRRLLFACCFLSLFASGALAADFATLLQPQIWNQSQDSFDEQARMYSLRWTSQARDSARAAGEGLTFLNLPVYEMLIQFQSGKVSEIQALFYARGDAGDITKVRFDEIVRTAVEALNRHTGVPFTARGKDPTGAVKADGVAWSTALGSYLLEYSFTKEVKTRGIPFRAEFVRLEITPPATAPAGLSMGSKSQLEKPVKFRGADRVKRDLASGDVWVDNVPMVDQGAKGYCVVATMERLLRLYGRDADLNELAQVANTGTEGGTSTEAMLEALKRLGARFKVRVRVHEDLDWQGFCKLIAEYNRAAKRQNVPKAINPEEALNWEDVYASVQGEAWLTLRTRNRSDVSRFMRDVKQHVDLGLPLAWSVRLGLYTETKSTPQQRGGHMRLIIGYNEKTSEILFSDSWGAGHEIKRIALTHAVAMTHNMATLEPY